jgi:hypothetical protein
VASPCVTDDVFDGTEATGTHPVSIDFVYGTGIGWAMAWLSGSSVYFRAMNSGGNPLTGDFLVDGAGGANRSMPLVAAGTGSDDELSAVVFGRSDQTAQYRLLENLSPGFNPVVASSGDLGGSGIPVPTGIAERGASTSLSATVHAGAATLTLFDSDGYQGSTTFGSAVQSAAPVTLSDGSFAVAYVEDGVLKFATAPDDVSSSTLHGALTGTSPLGSGPEHHVAAARIGDQVVAVWVDASGVHLTRVEEDGTAGGTSLVQAGNGLSYPRIIARSDYFGISWLDPDDQALFIRRFSTDFTTCENRFQVASGVADEAYGMAVDAVSSRYTVGFAYNTTRIRLGTIDCGE